jgi:hypothetical protein
MPSQIIILSAKMKTGNTRSKQTSDWYQNRCYQSQIAERSSQPQKAIARLQVT